MITKQIWQQIKEADVITIYRHVKPDGDATGSQMGLKGLIKTNLKGKKVYCLGSPNTYHGRLIGKVDEDVDRKEIERSLAIVLDTPNMDRVDDQSFKMAKNIIKIDHHIFVDDFGGLEWINTSAVAACEMVITLAYDNELVISEEAAKALYLGLVTDSNRFLYNPTPQTFLMASKLIEAKADINSIHSFLYEGPENMLRFKGYCQMNFIRTEHGVAYNKIDESILKKYGVTGHDAAGMVNNLANIIGVNIHVNFCQIEDGIRVEFRSKEIPVNFIAAKYGGGGHKLASGARVASWEIVDAIIADLDELCFNNLKEVD